MAKEASEKTEKVAKKTTTKKETVKKETVKKVQIKAKISP